MCFFNETEAYEFAAKRYPAGERYAKIIRRVRESDGAVYWRVL